MHEPDDFAVWSKTIFKQFECFRKGEDLKPGYVPCTTFWLVEDNQFMGTGSIRHRLNESLEKYGGHIGYAIRFSHRKKGYGTKHLQLLLQEARKLKIEKALVTCDDDNVGSAKVIEKNGGVYQDTIDNVIDDKPIRTRRYWIGNLL